MIILGWILFLSGSFLAILTLLVHFSFGKIGIAEVAEQMGFLIFFGCLMICGAIFIVG